MSLLQVYPKFITDVQAEIARRGKGITDRLEGGDSFDEVVSDIFKLRNLIQELENYFVTDHEIVGLDSSQWFSYIRYKCSGRTADHLIELDMQRIYKEYCITTYPGMLFPLAPIYVGYPGTSCCGLPPYPTNAEPGDYYLSYDYSTNSYVWYPSGNFVYRKEFLWNGGSQEFTVNISASKVHMVFVNGQLLPQWAYELDGYVVRLLTPPVTLDNSRNPVRIIVYAGPVGSSDIVIDDEGFTEVKDEAGVVQFNSSVNRSFAMIGVGIDIFFDPIGNKIIINSMNVLNGLLFKEEFVWTSGGQSFTLDNPATAILIMAINGQIQGSGDITHTSGSDIITAIDELEPDDEIMVLYTLAP